MKKKPKKVRKPHLKRKASVKQRLIMDQLREEIISGKYPPGSKIPIQIQLVEEFGMSSVTIQRAVHALKAQGFLRANRRMGTFVVDRPPHLVNYALVFPHSPISSPVWSHFYETLRTEAVLLGQQTGKNIECFFAVNDFERSPDYLRLVAQVRERQLAGIIFAAPPFLYLNTPLMDGPMPRVAIASRENVHLGIPLVSANQSTVIEMAVNHFIKCKRSRIAFFTTAPVHVDEWLRRQYEFSGSGIVTKEHWCFAIAANLPKAANSCIRLLMEIPEHERPDGVIVMDDHLLEPVEEGILTAPGVDSKSVDVVGQCNLPDRFGHVLPIQKLGFVASDLLRKSMELIDLQQKGEKVPQVTTVEPVQA